MSHHCRFGTWYLGALFAKLVFSFTESFSFQFFISQCMMLTYLLKVLGKLNIQIEHGNIATIFFLTFSF